MFNFFNNQNGNENASINNRVAANVVGDFETLQKARKDLIGEIEAIIHYDDHIHSTTDKIAIETWEDIKSEELNHVGQLLGLLNYLDPSQQQYVVQGMKEFTDRLNKK